MKDFVLITAATYGAIAVILGAFGAHLLKKKFTPEQLASFETGVRYQTFHALLLLLIGFQLPFQSALENLMSGFFILGTFLFSFSIYGLCLSSLGEKKWSFLGPVTPLGGVFLITGWIMLLIFILQS